MNDFITQAEQLLLSEAQKYCPEGSETKAVVHQWLNAIAYKKSLFGEQVGVSPKHIITLLKKNGLFTTVEKLKAEMHEN
ncbi:MAG: ubiquinone biosynthesis protein COQ9, partial [Oleiphilaceae bacterium]